MTREYQPPKSDREIIAQLERENAELLARLENMMHVAESLLVVVKSGVKDDAGWWHVIGRAEATIAAVKKLTEHANTLAPPRPA